jgi:hypothetical protein
MSERVNKVTVTLVIGGRAAQGLSRDFPPSLVVTILWPPLSCIHNCIEAPGAMNLEFFVMVAAKEGLAGEVISAVAQAHQAIIISAHKELSDQKHHSIHRNFISTCFERLDLLMIIFHFFSLRRVECSFDGAMSARQAEHVSLEGGLP